MPFWLLKQNKELPHLRSNAIGYTSSRASGFNSLLRSLLYSETSLTKVKTNDNSIPESVRFSEVVYLHDGLKTFTIHLRKPYPVSTEILATVH